MDPTKVHGVMEWPTPMKVKEVQSFLGFVNFYWKLIHNKEMLAIMCALDEWHHFLEGMAEKFEILMDHWNLTYFHNAVGRITVCYGAHLQSPVLWVRSYHQDCIIFDFSFYIQNSAKILVELEFWIFKSDPNLVVDISLNQDYSGDSNSGIYVSIPALWYK